LLNGYSRILQQPGNEPRLNSDFPRDWARILPATLQPFLQPLRTKVSRPIIGTRPCWTINSVQLRLILQKDRLRGAKFAVHYPLGITAMPVRYSKTFRSGTPEYPTPRLLVERMIAELVSSRQWGWVTFETKPTKHFVEVALEGDDELVINAAYGFSEDYQTLFARQQVTVPDGWRVTKFKKKGWLGAGTMLLTTGIRDVDRIAEFIDGLFPALYGEQASYQLSGTFQSSP